MVHGIFFIVRICCRCMTVPKRDSWLSGYFQLLKRVRIPNSETLRKQAHASKFRELIDSWLRTNCIRKPRLCRAYRVERLSTIVTINRFRKNDISTCTIYML